MKGATLFSGFEGVGIGMKAAGIQHAWGIEYDAEIAAVARLNGFNTIVADILDCDPASLERVDFLHASPPCPNFSNAKANGKETEHDIALARKVAEFIAVLRPSVFTLENVYQYRTSQSWGIVERALHEAGYLFDYWHVNTADYGIPQTRQRMIAIARLDGIRPQLPPATHAENPILGLFGTLKPWVGWYEAIEGLIPGLPESKFAKWQLERLPAELRDNLYFNNQTNYGEGLHTTNGSEPAPTIVSTQKTLSAHRAFIVDGKLSTSGDEKKLQILDQVTPHATVVSSISAMKDSKAYTSGRVVQMTPRALARFQSFPDDYLLPEQKRLACRGIGNAVPPLFAKRLFEALT